MNTQENVNVIVRAAESVVSDTEEFRRAYDANLTHIAVRLFVNALTVSRGCVKKTDDVVRAFAAGYAAGIVDAGAVACVPILPNDDEEAAE